jgi:hypothetical protein
MHRPMTAASAHRPIWMKLQRGLASDPAACRPPRYPPSNARSWPPSATTRAGTRLSVRRRLALAPGQTCFPPAATPERHALQRPPSRGSRDRQRSDAGREAANGGRDALPARSGDARRPRRDVRRKVKAGPADRARVGAPRSPTMWPFDPCCILSLSRSTTGVAGQCSCVPDQHSRLGRIEARTPAQVARAGALSRGHRSIAFWVEALARGGLPS